MHMWGQMEAPLHVFFIHGGKFMGIVELFLIAVGLSMDAFAVSICKGLSVQRLRVRHMLLAGLYFGAFQALMPLVGYFLGARFASMITAYDHWITFVLLALIGGNMIREALGSEEECQTADFSPRAMLPLAVATSIDALAVGVSFAFMKVQIFSAVGLIGITTFCFGVAGVKIGNVFGSKYESKAELVGGAILILIGTKILLEHLGILG